MATKELDPMIGAEVLELDLGLPDTGGEVERDLQSTLQALLQEALDHHEEHIEPDQVEATDYYFARPFGDEKKGRSSVVSTDLRDTVLDRVPDLLEIFMGSDSVVEYRPRGPEDEAQAEQETDYVNYLFFERNPGFLNLNAAIKDAEVRRLGYLKWSWEENSRVEGETHTGLTEEDLLVIVEDEEVDDYEILREYEGTAPQMDPETGQTMMAPTVLFDCEVQRRRKQGKLCIDAVPPEEIVFTPAARSLEKAQIVAHVREVPQDELRLMGIPEDLIEEQVARQESRGSEHLEWSRQFYGDGKRGALRDRADVKDDTQDPVAFAEVYALMDADGDGIAELRCFQCVGPDHRINPERPMGELISHVPIAVFNGEPEPHTIPGLCTFDHTRDIQRIKSQVQRAQMNSLAQAVEPQLAVQDKAVNIGDLLNPEINGIVRVRGDVNNSIREIKTTFVGAETLDVLAYYDTIKGERTGQAGPREGLDPNVLQSTTREAVSSNLSKGQRRILMSARAYAEVGLKQAFRGIRQTLIENQAPAEVVRLRNQWVQVDPRSWHADRDVSVNVALGTGSKQERIDALLALAEKQEAHLQMGSPLVTFAELRHTYRKLTELLGYKNADAFFRPWGPQEQQQFEQAQAQKPPSDPQMALVEVERMRAEAQMQIEQMKVQAQIQMDQMKMQLEQWKAQMQDDRERDKLARESVLKERELEAKHAVDIHDAELKAQVARDRAAMDADVKHEVGRAAPTEG